MRYGDAARLGFDSYFNSGVMLLNLQKMRDNGTSAKMIEMKKTRTDLHYMDQDVLNIAFDQNVVWCSLDYNFKPAYLKMSANQLRSEFGYVRPKSELPTIFHWADKKPWNEKVAFYKLWLKYKQESPARNIHVKTEPSTFWQKLMFKWF